jgi:hypothetical protein
MKRAPWRLRNVSNFQSCSCGLPKRQTDSMMNAAASRASEGRQPPSHHYYYEPPTLPPSFRPPKEDFARKKGVDRRRPRKECTFPEVEKSPFPCLSKDPTRTRRRSESGEAGALNRQALPSATQHQCQRRSSERSPSLRTTCKGRHLLCHFFGQDHKNPRTRRQTHQPDAHVPRPHGRVDH